MERFWTLITYALAALVAWWAGLHNAYRLLAIFQGIDIALGVLGALGKDAEGKRKFRSNIGLAGITRRTAQWLLILAVAAMEKEAQPVVIFAVGALGDDFVPVVLKSITISAGLAYATAFFEFSSIVENVRGFGVQVPRWFIEILKKAEVFTGLTAEEKVKK